MRQFLENVTGLSIYPMLSLVIFMVVFLLVIVIAYTRSKGYYTNMRNLPIELEDESTPATAQAPTP